MSKQIVYFSIFSVLIDGLKLTPIQQQTHRVDVSSEAQLLASVFKDAYTFVHTERMKALSEEMKSVPASTFDSLLHSRFVRKLKSSIERWTLLAEKLHQSVPASSSTTFKQAFEEANNNLAANKALLGQLYIMNSQDYLALHELQVACPILSDYDIAVRTSYFDGWVDCYAALGHLHMKIENFDVALDLQTEMLGKMPWMRLALPSVTANITQGGGIKLSEFAEPSILSYLWGCSPLDRLSIAEQTRRVWLAARTIRARLNDLVSDFIKSKTKREQLIIYVGTQKMLEEELARYMNSAASAAMVSDMILSSDASPDLETLENMTRPFSNDDGYSSSPAHMMSEAELNSLVPKVWLAEMIKDFRRQLFKEASFYLQTMDGLIVHGEEYLADALLENESPNLRITLANMGDNIDALPLSVSNESRPLLELFSAPIGFQSREGVRLTFEYFHVQFVEQPKMKSDDAAAAAASASAEIADPTSSVYKASRSRASANKKTKSARASRTTSASPGTSKSTSASANDKSSFFSGWRWDSVSSMIAFVALCAPSYFFWKSRDSKSSHASHGSHYSQLTNSSRVGMHTKGGGKNKSAKDVDFDRELLLATGGQLPPRRGVFESVIALYASSVAFVAQWLAKWSKKLKTGGGSKKLNRSSKDVNSKSHQQSSEVVSASTKPLGVPIADSVVAISLQPPVVASAAISAPPVKGNDAACGFAPVSATRVRSSSTPVVSLSLPSTSAITTAAAASIPASATSCLAPTTSSCSTEPVVSNITEKHLTTVAAIDIKDFVSSDVDELSPLAGSVKSEYEKRLLDEYDDTAADDCDQGEWISLPSSSSSSNGKNIKMKKAIDKTYVSRDDKNQRTSFEHRRKEESDKKRLHGHGDTTSSGFLTAAASSHGRFATNKSPTATSGTKSPTNAPVGSDKDSNAHNLKSQLPRFTSPPLLHTASSALANGGSKSPPGDSSSKVSSVTGPKLNYASVVNKGNVVATPSASVISTACLPTRDDNVKKSNDIAQSPSGSPRRWTKQQGGNNYDGNKTTAYVPRNNNNSNSRVRRNVVNSYSHSPSSAASDLPVSVVVPTDPDNGSSHDSDSSLTTGESKTKYHLVNNGSEGNLSQSQINMKASAVASNGAPIDDNASSASSHQGTVGVVTIAPINNHHHHHHHQPIEIVTQIVHPQAFITQSTDMYGNLTNQNYVIMTNPSGAYEMASVPMPMVYQHMENAASYAVYQQMGQAGMQIMNNSAGMPFDESSQQFSVNSGNTTNNNSNSKFSDNQSGHGSSSGSDQLMHEQAVMAMSNSSQPLYYYPQMSSSGGAIPMNFDANMAAAMASHMQPVNMHPGFAYQYYPMAAAPSAPVASPIAAAAAVTSAAGYAMPSAGKSSPATAARPQQQSHKRSTGAEKGSPRSAGPGPVEDTDIISALRYQIEYYFSVENLRTDFYLRGKMDPQGYVMLQEISKFRRILNLRATAQQILEAVQSSQKLDVLVPVGGETLNLADTAAILATKIRSTNDRMLWETYSNPSTPSRSNSPYLWAQHDSNSHAASPVSAKMQSAAEGVNENNPVSA